MDDKSNAHGQYPSSLVLMFLWARLSWRARSVLMVLVVQADRDKKATILRKTVQSKCGFKQLKDVDKGVSELIDVGMVKRHHRYDPEKQENLSNVYELLFDPDEVPFAKMPAWIIHNGVWAEMSYREQSLLIVLKALAHGNAFHQIGQKALCRYADISNLKYLREALQGLVEKDMIRIEETHNEEGGTAEHKYHLLV